MGKDEGEGSLTKVLDRIAFGSAEQIGKATKNVPGAANNLVKGVTGVIPLPDLLPDMEKIDEMVEVGTMSAYALMAFGISGTLFFTLKTFREFGQWRQWMRFNKTLRNKSKKP